MPTLTEKPDEKPDAKAAVPDEKKVAPKPVHLLLLKPVNGIIAQRIVTVEPDAVKTLVDAEIAKIATQKQVRMAGSRIVHLNA